MNTWMIAENSMKRHYLKKKKKDVYSHLNIEDITAKDYARVKRICKDFEIKKSRRIS